MIVPFNSQFSGNHLALHMGLQTGLFCNAALAGPHIFWYSQKSAWYRLGAVGYSIGKQSLSTLTMEQVVDEKSLTSDKLQSVLNICFVVVVIFYQFEIVLVTFLLMSLKTFIDMLLILMLLTSILLKDLKFAQNQLILVFQRRNYSQKGRYLNSEIQLKEVKQNFSFCFQGKRILVFKFLTERCLSGKIIAVYVFVVTSGSIQIDDEL